MASPDQATLPSIEVTGTAVVSEHDEPQSIDTIDHKELAEQQLTLLQDALRNVPGITLNSGEGGAHGDSVNLRGLSIPDSFFLDGVLHGWARSRERVGMRRRLEPCRRLLP